MTDINVSTSTAPIESSEVAESLEGVEASGEAKVSGENDPNESFSDWLKRQDSSKGSKASKSDSSESKLPPAPDISDKVEKALEGDAKDATESPVSNENDNIRVLKVGDKKFKAEDVAKLDKDFAEVNTKYESQVQENQRMIADVEKFVDTLRKNPGEILDRFKITQEQIEQYLWDKHYKFKNESPIDKATRLEKELNDIKNKDENDRLNARRQQEIEANTKFWQGKIKEGLDAHGLPENQYTVQRMVGYIQQMQQKGLNISMADLANYVKQDYEAAQAESLKNMSPDQVAKVLGKETLDKVRAQEVEKLKQDKFKNTNPGQGKIKREEPKKKVHKSVYDMLDDL